MSNTYGQVEVTSRAQWLKWLAGHHATAPGTWLVTFRKADAARYVPYDDIVEEALCFGWVDSQRVERLEAASLMTKAGRAAVASAQADGSWSALDALENLVDPDDVRSTLDAEPAARREWDAFPRSTKRGILEWIASAKRPPTRAKRIAETAEQAAQGIRANQWRQPQRGYEWMTQRTRRTSSPPPGPGSPVPPSSPRMRAT